MNVLHVYRTYYPDPPGGLQEAIKQISTATQSLGAKVRIFALSPDPVPARLDLPEAEVFRSRSWVAPASTDLGGPDSFRMYRELADWADVLHFHFPWPFADLLHLSSGRRKPSVMTYHSDIVRQRWLSAIYKPVMERMLASTDAIVATSPTYAHTSRVLSDRRFRGAVRVIPLGIAEETCSAAPDPTVFDRIRLSADEPYFLFVGVLRYYKGLHVLLEAAARISAKIVVAGMGPEASRLIAQSEKLGLRNVHFAGKVSEGEKLALISGCRALVLPSHLRSEAFGMVLVEASMHAKPMISCDIGTGTSFVNSNRKTGLIVPPENSGELARAMDELLKEKDLALLLGRAARQRYESLFSGGALARAYCDLYSEVLTCARTHAQ